MFNRSFIIILILSFPSLAFANSVTRAVKKGANRVGEALCMEGEIKCAAKKAGNRITEAKDAAVDKVKEVKAKLD